MAIVGHGEVGDGRSSAATGSGWGDGLGLGAPQRVDRVAQLGHRLARGGQARHVDGAADPLLVVDGQRRRPRGPGPRRAARAAPAARSSDTPAVDRDLGARRPRRSTGCGSTRTRPRARPRRPRAPGRRSPAGGRSGAGPGAAGRSATRPTGASGRRRRALRPPRSRGRSGWSTASGSRGSSGRRDQRPPGDDGVLVLLRTAAAVVGGGTARSAAAPRTTGDGRVRGRLGDVGGGAGQPGGRLHHVGHEDGDVVDAALAAGGGDQAGERLVAVGQRQQRRRSRGRRPGRRARRCRTSAGRRRPARAGTASASAPGWPLRTRSSSERCGWTAASASLIRPSSTSDCTQLWSWVRRRSVPVAQQVGAAVADVDQARARRRRRAPPSRSCPCRRARRRRR